VHTLTEKWSQGRLAATTTVTLSRGLQASRLSSALDISFLLIPWIKIYLD